MATAAKVGERDGQAAGERRSRSSESDPTPRRIGWPSFPGARGFCAGYLLTLTLAGCAEPSDSTGANDDAAATSPPAEASSTAPAGSQLPGNAYFGDLHVHTRYSFDAFIFGTRADPDAAYRFAKGEAIPHPAGFEMQLRRPLDFEAVTDHASYLGMLAEMNDPSTAAGQHPLAKVVQEATTTEKRRAAFQQIGGLFRGDLDGTGLYNEAVVRTAWQSIISAAEKHNEPGKFTTFIGYEFTATGSERENLHRNVIFKDSRVAALPFSRLDSTNPEMLWRWMDDLRDQGIESLAIPHNSNGSNGRMFEMTDWAGAPIDAAYAERRLRNEPLVEITQVKGTSETHPALSPNDEWANFEIMPYRIATTLPSQPPGSYVRDAYLRGLTLEATVGANPYRFGMAGASDTHVAAGSFEEYDYWSKVGMLDYRPALRGSVPDASGKYSDTYYRFWSASGLTGVWAEANTREAIYAAFRRKETFATSGPRIKVRFFAGYGLDENAVASDATDGLPNESVAALYASATPMGSDLLPAGDAAPTFLVWALRDPLGAPLERAQIIKGWYEDGKAREQVYDVACSDGGSVDPVSHRCPDNGTGVSLNDCSLTGGKGAGELLSTWQDPDFDPAGAAFYYVRVLENPSCRWSTWDALRADVAPREGLAATIQERAWTSPIWFRP